MESILFFFLLVLGITAIVYLYIKRKNLLIIDDKGIYTSRAGWYSWSEISKAELKEVQKIFFKKRTCIFLYLTDSRFDVPLYENWILYVQPTKIAAICQSDTDEPLDQVLAKIKKHL